MFDLKKAWKIVNSVYLFSDYVHLMKSIRNDWITEMLQELSYDDGRTAKLEYIKILYEKEKNTIVKLSKLTETAVSPKPIEHQNVSLCLKVFCDKTIAALKLQNNHPDDAIEFLTRLVKFFKTANVKGQFEKVHTNDKTVLSSPDDERLNFLLNLADMVEKMLCERQVVRAKQLTKDTSRAFSHTCRGMVDLTKHLLKNGFGYVCLGHFSSDPVEKMVGKLRQGSEAPTS